MTLNSGGDRRDGSAERRAEVAFDEPQLGAVGEPLTVANECTEVVVRRVETRNGSRLLIVAPKSGQWISLDALEVEGLTRQNTRTLAAMVGSLHSPLLPDAIGGADGNHRS